MPRTPNTAPTKTQDTDTPGMTMPGTDTPGTGTMWRSSAGCSG